MLLIISMSLVPSPLIGGLVVVAVLAAVAVLIADKGRERAIYSVLGVGLLIAFALLVFVAFGGSHLSSRPVP